MEVKIKKVYPPKKRKRLQDGPVTSWKKLFQEVRRRVRPISCFTKIGRIHQFNLEKFYATRDIWEGKHKRGFNLQEVD